MKRKPKGKKRSDRKPSRRKSAEDRQAARDKLSPEQQIEKLNAKFGVGQGAKKERQRLAKEIEAR